MESELVQDWHARGMPVCREQTGAELSENREQNSLFSDSSAPHTHRFPSWSEQTLDMVGVILKSSSSLDISIHSHFFRAAVYRVLWQC